MERIIRQANIHDLNAITSFLTKTKLEVEGIENWLGNYLLVQDVNKEIIQGTVGIQPFGAIGLLRSFVLEQANGQDILFLVQQIIILAKEKEFESLYCMLQNKNAIQLFELLGFQPIEIQEVPTIIRKSNGVKKLETVNNLEFMHLPLKNVDN